MIKKGNKLNSVLRNSFARIKEDITRLGNIQSISGQKIDELRNDISYFKEKAVTIDRMNLIKIKLGEFDEKLSNILELKSDIKKLDREFVSVKAFESALADMKKKLEGINKAQAELLSERQLKRFGEEVIKKLKVLEGQYKEIKETHNKLEELEKKTVHISYFEKQISEMTDMISSIKEDYKLIRDNFVARRDYSLTSEDHRKRLESLEKHAVTKKELAVPVKELKALQKQAVKINPAILKKQKKS